MMPSQPHRLLALLLPLITASCHDAALPDPVNSVWSVHLEPVGLRWEHRCDDERLELVLEDSRGRAQARHEIDYRHSFTRKRVSRWGFTVPSPGDYTLQALVTRCGGEQLEVRLLSLRVDQEHTSRFVWLRLQEFTGETDIVYVETSRWASGLDTLEITDSQGAKTVTLRNLSGAPVPRCESAPYIDVEYEVQGRWVPFGSTKWPDGLEYLDADTSAEFRASGAILRQYPTNGDRIQPTRKRYLVFYEPPQVNQKLFDRIRDLGYVSSGSGCDIYYLIQTSDETDPLVTPLGDEVHTYTF